MGSALFLVARLLLALPESVARVLGSSLIIFLSRMSKMVRLLFFFTKLIIQNYAKSLIYYECCFTDRPIVLLVGYRPYEVDLSFEYTEARFQREKKSWLRPFQKHN